MAWFRTAKRNVVKTALGSKDRTTIVSVRSVTPPGHPRNAAGGIRECARAMLPTQMNVVEMLRANVWIARKTTTNDLRGKRLLLQNAEEAKACAHVMLPMRMCGQTARPPAVACSVQAATRTIVHGIAVVRDQMFSKEAPSETARPGCKVAVKVPEAIPLS